MAAEARTKIWFALTGLGRELNFNDNAVTTSTPTAATYHYEVLTTADTPEALDLGDVSTVELIIIRAIDYNIEIDCDYVSAFDADLTVKAGKTPAVIPNPAGTVYWSSVESDETPAVEYIVIGTT